MAVSVNYYAELGLDPGASQEQLEADLRKLRRTWTNRASSGSDLDARQTAERKVALIREATETLLNAEKRAKYDKELKKNGAPEPSSQNQYSAPSAGSAAFMDNAQLMDMLEGCYENNRYNQAIAAGKKLLENGVRDTEVYRILICSYIDKGEENQAYRLLSQMEKDMPDDPDALLLIATVLLKLMPGREAEAKQYLDRLTEAGYGDTAEVAALDIEYQIDTGNLEAADQKLNAFTAANGKDTLFCMNVSGAYVQAANRYATEYGGDMYFDNQKSFNNFAALMDKANSIYEFEGNRQLVKDLKSTTMVPDWWIGVLCFILYGGALYSVSVVASIAMFACAIFFFAFSRVPNWMLLRFEYKKHLCGIYEFVRILNIIFSIWFRVGWAIFKFILGMVFSFL